MRLQLVNHSSSIRAGPAASSGQQCGTATASRRIEHTLHSIASPVWLDARSAVPAVLLATALAHAQPALAAPDVAAASDFPRLPAFMQGSFDRFREQKLSEQSRQAQADAAFQQSDTLQELLARSKANRQKNLEEIENKYCERSWLQCLEFMKTVEDDPKAELFGKR